MIKIGDTFTIKGVVVMVPNPERRWWQFWKSRLIATDVLQQFRVNASI